MINMEGERKKIRDNWPKICEDNFVLKVFRGYFFNNFQYGDSLAIGQSFEDIQ